MSKPPRTRIFCADDARRLARRKLPRLVFDFIEGAAGRELSAERNMQAFDRVSLQARVMGNVAQRSLSRRFLGHAFDLPFGIAPMGMCNLVRPGADRMLARASAEFGLPVCLSSAASSTIEEMRAWAGPRAWFQLYVNGTPEDALALVDRAEAAGYEILVLTVDVPQVSRRVRDIRNGFTIPFRIGPRQFLDFALHPGWSVATLLNGPPAPRNFATGKGTGTSFDRNASRAGADWQFLDRLRRRWRGKLIVKGVTHRQDARRVCEAGADAVWVSNHGGRQLDSAPPAITVLPGIREAVGPLFPLVFDSGVRSGEDVVRALASGADFVMLGRPLLFAIGAEGQAGLDALLSALAEDISVAMAQLGLSDIAEISQHNLAGTGDIRANAMDVHHRPDNRQKETGT